MTAKHNPGVAGEYHEHNMTKAKTKSVPSDFPWPESEDENRVETCLYLGFKLVSRWVKTPVKKYNGWMGYCRVFSRLAVRFGRALA